MIKLTKNDVRELVDFLEYFLDSESTVQIATIMKKYGITFEEYRILSELAMPAIRRKNELNNMKARATYYKTSRDKYKDKLEKVDDALGMAQSYLNVRNEDNVISLDEALDKAKEWLDAYFKPPEVPSSPVIKKPDGTEEIEEAKAS